MTRKPRVHYFKAFYHVMVRGNHRQDIFFCEKDRMQFYNFLADACDYYDCRIHLFCLMSNHLHLVIEVGHVPLAKIMQNIISRYARYQNKQQNRKGHLCEGRYSAVPIQNEKYLLELCYYIHRNPVKARIVSNIDYYPWSSHRAYCLIENIPWLTTEFMLEVLKKNIAVENDHYRYFMQNQEKNCEEPCFCMLDANKELVIRDTVSVQSQKLQNNRPIRISLDRIIMVICEHLQIPLEQLSSPSLGKKIVLARSFVTYFAHYRAGHRLIDIAQSLGRRADSISKTTHNILKQLHSDYRLKQLFLTLERKLSQITE